MCLESRKPSLALTWTHVAFVSAAMDLPFPGQRARSHRFLRPEHWAGETPVLKKKCRSNSERQRLSEAISQDQSKTCPCLCYGGVVNTAEDTQGWLRCSARLLCFPGRQAGAMEEPGPRGLQALVSWLSALASFLAPDGEEGSCALTKGKWCWHR